MAKVDDAFAKVRVSSEFVMVAGLKFTKSSRVYDSTHESPTIYPGLRYVFQDLQGDSNMFMAYLIYNHGYLRVETRVCMTRTDPILISRMEYLEKDSCSSLIGPAVTTCGCGLPDTDDDARLQEFITKHLIGGSCETIATKRYCINNVEYTEKNFAQKRKQVLPYWANLIKNQETA